MGVVVVAVVHVLGPFVTGVIATGRGGQPPVSSFLRDSPFSHHSGLALSSAQCPGWRKQAATKKLLFVFIMGLCTLERSPSYTEV